MTKVYRRARTYARPISDLAQPGIGYLDVNS